MPKAEVGSTKHLANKMKSKGLQRLRWYCQVCEKQCRDENGFKCHTQSESHVRAMQAVGADPRRAIADFSQQFQRDFILQLRTAHGTKPVHINHFYQEYISHKEHVHMNATRWPSLTEFAKFLGREGICRVDETDKGLHIAWIDASPDALRRQATLQQRERQERGDEEREQKMLREQIARAQAQARADGEGAEAERPKPELVRPDGAEKIKLSFGPPKTSPAAASAGAEKLPTPPQTDSGSGSEQGDKPVDSSNVTPAPASAAAPAVAPKPKNIFAAAGKKASNPFASKKPPRAEQAKKMSEVERIMRAEMERSQKRKQPGGGGVGFSIGKKQRVD
ncbi:hypothetical protein FH972_023668 [Carpinus fangiana]|uniref:DNA/RNA-binding protein Kin17 WH-like domain-containing protein n=1 Tax=Carpinus fangiana TaxID=176857 RepID=A0A5N6KWC5_9ROSI|nr:hypothetical protein FH972_023668 [Carpinus fangiana]